MLGKGTNTPPKQHLFGPYDQVATTWLFAQRVGASVLVPEHSINTDITILVGGLNIRPHKIFTRTVGFVMMSPSINCVTTKGLVDEFGFEEILDVERSYVYMSQLGSLDIRLLQDCDGRSVVHHYLHRVLSKAHILQ
jgi:hypothetical protein